MWLFCSNSFSFSDILDEFLQQYGSLIPIHVDEVVEKLQEIFNESFSSPQRSELALTSYKAY